MRSIKLLLFISLFIIQSLLSDAVSLGEDLKDVLNNVKKGLGDIKGIKPIINNIEDIVEEINI